MLTQHLRTLLLTEAKRHESFYFYDEQTLKESIHHLQQAFPHEQILYSIKCNPHRAMLKTIFASGTMQTPPVWEKYMLPAIVACHQTIFIILPREKVTIVWKKHWDNAFSSPIA